MLSCPSGAFARAAPGIDHGIPKATQSPAHRANADAIAAPLSCRPDAGFAVVSQLAAQCRNNRNAAWTFPTIAGRSIRIRA